MAKASRRRAATTTTSPKAIGSGKFEEPKDELGEFPFPLTDRSFEPSTVQWLRNHSSYLTVGGLHDYFVPIAVLARGIAVNFLILVPWLILIALVLSSSHHWIINQEFLLLQLAAGVAVFLVLVYLAGAPMLRIWRYRQSLEKGSIDTVEQRLWREKLLGFALILIIVIAFIELSPQLIEYFRRTFGASGLTWSQKIASVVGLSTVLGSSNAILSMLSGYKRTVAIVGIGFAGLMVPWIIILYLTNYLVYDAPPSEFLLALPWWASATCATLIFIAFLSGNVKRSFSGKEIRDMAGLCLVVIGIVVGLWFAKEYAVQQAKYTNEQLGELSRPISRIVSKPLFDEDDQSDHAQKFRELLQMKTSVDEKVNARPPRDSATSGQWQHEYYQMAQQLIERAEDLKILTDVQQSKVSSAIAKRDRRVLMEMVSKKGEKVSEEMGRSLLKDQIARDTITRFVRNESANMDLEWKSDKEEPIRENIDGFIRKRFDAYRKKTAKPKSKSNPVRVPETPQQRIRKVRLPPTFVQEFQELTEAKKSSDKPTNKLSLPGHNEMLSSVTVVDKNYPDEKLDLFAAEAEMRFFLEAQSFETLRTILELETKRNAEVPTSSSDPTDKSELSASKAGSEDSNSDDDASTDDTADDTTETNDPKSENTSESTATPVVEPTSFQQQIETVLITKAMAYFSTRQIMLLADTEHVVYLDVPEIQDGYSVPTGDTDDTTTIWHAVQALESEGNSDSEQDRAKKARNLLAKFYAVHEEGPEAKAKEIARHARIELIHRALRHGDGAKRNWARQILGELFKPSVPTIIPGLTREEAEPIRGRLYYVGVGEEFESDELLEITAARFVDKNSRNSDPLVARLVTGEFGYLEGLDQLDERMFIYALVPKLVLVVSWGIVICLLCWLAADININSLHGYYRDRLARAFLIRNNRKQGRVEVEDDIALASIADRQARSTAPYHIINVALNLQGSNDVALRDRNSDFFVFTKRFVGGKRTGYCRTSTLGQIFPQASLSTAMAVSAAAAAPNMGRITNPFLVLLMTLLNIRLGFWLPNPGLLEENQNERRWRRRRADAKDTNPNGFQFEDVFQHELMDIQSRWTQAYGPKHKRKLKQDTPPGQLPSDPNTRQEVKIYNPSVQHGLVGLAFSGGGIRSATLNLGILQVLNKSGVFQHVDLLSTVSGGGYLGSSISALMRARTTVFSENDGTVTIKNDGDECVVTIQGSETKEYRFAKDAQLNVRSGQNVGLDHRLIRGLTTSVHAEFDGTVKVIPDPVTNEQIVTVSEESEGGSSHSVQYKFTEFDPVIVKTGDAVVKGEPLVARRSSLAQRFRWGVAPRCLYREMFGLLHEKGNWVNLSDGGHIENLAVVELLRRRCKIIIAGDGEADPNHTFNGLATLLRFARIDLGIEIDIDLGKVRKNPDTGVAESHWAIGKITYPIREGDAKPETGFLLYLKSSVTNDEGELINEYRNNYPDFPHQSTADQFFNEGQFEAYRALGQHIGEQVLDDANVKGQVSYSDLEVICRRLWSKRN